MADPSELLAQEAARMQEHTRRYLADGADVHLYDTSHIGGRVDTTTLLLKTIGRRSGNVLYTPLIYVPWGDEFAIAASKGGADAHPAWYLNLTARPDVSFKVARRMYRGGWREVSGEERGRVWDALAAHYAPYLHYAKITTREIPVLVLHADEQVSEI